MIEPDYIVITFVLGSLIVLALILCIPCKSCKGYYWSQGSQTG